MTRNLLVAPLKMLYPETLLKNSFVSSYGQLVGKKLAVTETHQCIRQTLRVNISHIESKPGM